MNILALIEGQRRREPWRLRAACRGKPTEWWFPHGGADNGDRGLAHCEGCPVKAQCLDWALEQEHQTGIYGGMSERARRLEKRRRREAEAGA